MSHDPGQRARSTDSSIYRNGLIAARSAIDRDFAVFPCRRPADLTADGTSAAKMPLWRRWQETCITEAGELDRWPSPAHNCGIACGPSCIVVIDTDPPDGEANLAAVGELPPTFTVRTPRGGHHRYYCAGEHIIRNSAGLIAAHVDVRARGGYVLASGSATPDGWYEIADDRALAMLPAWLAERCMTHRTERSAVPAVVGCLAAGATRYGAAALSNESARVAAALPGTRAAQLNSSTFNLFKLAALGHIDSALITPAMLSAAEACGLLAEEGTRRVTTIIACAQRAALAQYGGTA